MKVAGKYRLLQIVGQGAVGTVYLARHVKLRHNADRVVKVIKEEMLKTSTTVQRFFREVQVTAELSESNDHIVRIYDDFGELPHLGYFYVMEFIRGMSVRQFIQKQTHLPPLEWCVDIMGQLSDALHTAHMAGVIHRDLKPDNMMLMTKGAHDSYLKVLDWGIAKPLTENIDVNLTQGLVGTPHYMAPEQAMNLEIDARTDIYAMSVIFYELLTGINPFVAATGKKGHSHDSMVDLINAQLYKEPPPIHEILPQRQDVSPALEAVLFKALEKKPKDRYNNVLEFWDAIQEATGFSATTPTSHLTASTTSQPSLLPPAIANPSMITPVPTGQYSKQHIGKSLPNQVDTEAPSQALADAARSGNPLAHQDSWQETAMFPLEKETTRNWSSIIGIALTAVLVLSVGTWGWLQSRSQKRSKQKQSSQQVEGNTPKPMAPIRPKARPQRIAALTPTHKKQPTGSLPRVRPQRAAVVTPPIANDAGSEVSDEGDDSPVEPKARRRTRRRRRTRKRRRTRRQRRTRRRRFQRVVVRRPVPVRPASPCSQGWRPVRIRPFLSSNAEITTEGGTWKRISSRFICVSTQTRRISIVQEGYALCIFRVPQRSTIRVRLLSADKGGISASNCLRR